jgi:hypothetical protein
MVLITPLRSRRKMPTEPNVKLRGQQPPRKLPLLSAGNPSWSNGDAHNPAKKLPELEL